MQNTKWTILIAIIISFLSGILFCWLANGRPLKTTSQKTPVENQAKTIEQSIPECFLGRCPTYISSDVDGDKESESLVIVPTAMTKGAGQLWIIDNGKVVFKSNKYAQISVKAALTGNGFTITHVDNKTFSEKLEKVFTYKEGAFVEEEL